MAARIVVVLAFLFAFAYGFAKLVVMAALAVSRLLVCQTLDCQIRTRPTQSSLHLFARLTIWEMAGAREDGDPRIRV